MAHRINSNGTIVEIPEFKFALKESLKDQKQFLPTKAEPLATGWDVRASLPETWINGSYSRSLEIQNGMYVKIPLGFRAFCPPGWWFELKPRSSSFAKKNLHALYGTIDETYEGELVFACQYLQDNLLHISYLPDYYEADEEDLTHQHISNPLIITHGDAIGQIIPVKRQDMLVEEISNEEYDHLCATRSASRGSGGFGSTGT